MPDRNLSFSLPRWRVTKWLADPGVDAPHDIRKALVASLFGSIPIYIGGILNTIAVAALVSWRVPTIAVLAWLVAEVAICALRLAALVISIRRAREGRETPTDLYILLGAGWAGTVGYGAFVSMLSGDWVSAALACLSAGGMAGGACFRNFGAPRLAAIMTALGLGPTALAAPFCGQPALLVLILQVPLYLYSMRIAAYRLNALLIMTMAAERENGRRAQEDPLTGLANRSGLTRAMEDGTAPSLAVFYLDLDGFKTVNDRHGHAAGDQLLQQAADRLRRLLRADDVAARIGGDEFVVVAPDVTRGQAPALGERLIREIAAPYAIAPGLEVSVGVSIGVALAHDHGATLADLLHAADGALYHAKSLGKSRWVIAGAGEPPKA